MTHQLIEINKLFKSKQNARRTVEKGAASDLKASIEAHGLMHNLVVTDEGNGRYSVTDGARRLEALQVLQAEGKLSADYAVPCQVRGADDALESSLAANTVRLAMHPADEFEAFARLAAGGMTPEQIATRFGKSEKHVQQRLMLGNADPKLLKAYRDGSLTLDCLMAFCLTDDRKRQMKVYRSLEGSGSISARAVRAALTDSMLEAGSKLARFVGLDTYRAAGGTTQSDLFSEAVYLENPELLNDLATARLADIRLELEAEGWGWIEVSMERDWNVTYGCGNIHPQLPELPPELATERDDADRKLTEIEEALSETESDELIDAHEAAQAELAEIDQRIELLAAFDLEEMRVAGCYVTISHDGSLSIEKGLVRKQDLKRLTSRDEPRERKPKGLPATLIRDLEGYRLQIARIAVARNRLIALDLLIFTAASQSARFKATGGADVTFHAHDDKVKEATKASDELKAIGEALPLDWLKPKKEADRFRAFTGLSDTQKLDLLAWCLASSLKPQLSTGSKESAYEVALSLTGIEPAGYWRPTAAGYLSRITRDQLLSLGRGLFGEPWAQAHSREKKGDLAGQLERAFATPEKYGRTPEQLEKLYRWLPDGMAFTPIAETPKATKKNARKAA